MLRLLDRQKRDLLRVVIVLIVLVNMLAFSHRFSTLAAGSNCSTSGPVSAAYTVTVCITAPGDGATLSGVRTISATVNVSIPNPGVAKLVFYLGGEYLLTDFQTP